MSEELLEKSEEVLEKEHDKKTLNELKRYLRSKGVKKTKELAFFVEYMRNGYNGAQAYKKVYQVKNYNTAKASASRMVSRVNLTEILDIVGLGSQELIETMHQLKDVDLKEYNSKLFMLNGLNKEKVEHSGDLTVTLANELDREYK